jgi:hypothetical protein
VESIAVADSKHQTTTTDEPQKAMVGFNLIAKVKLG